MPISRQPIENDSDSGNSKTTVVEMLDWNRKTKGELNGYSKVWKPTTYHHVFLWSILFKVICIRFCPKPTTISFYYREESKTLMDKGPNCSSESGRTCWVWRCCSHQGSVWVVRRKHDQSVRPFAGYDRRGGCSLLFAWSKMKGLKGLVCFWFFMHQLIEDNYLP